VLNVIADFTDLTSYQRYGGRQHHARLKDVPGTRRSTSSCKRAASTCKSGNVIWIAPRDELATREKLALESQSQINEL
jgi:type IV pilus assembly protein PilQ